MRLRVNKQRGETHKYQRGDRQFHSHNGLPFRTPAIYYTNEESNCFEISAIVLHRMSVREGGENELCIVFAGPGLVLS
jgi:hypothetical protein